MTQPEKNTKSPVRIVIIDDHPMVCERLTELIRTQPDLEVCGDANSMCGALDLVARVRPDLAIVDLSLKNSSGLDLIKELHKRHPRVRILVLSMYEESLYAERAIRAGARGYITKQEASSSIMDAIRQVLDGQIYLNIRMTGMLMQRLLNNPPNKKHDALDELTDREMEVFQLLARGQNNRIIGQQLGVSARTIETYRTRIKEKLSLSNTAELLQYAVAWRMTQGNPSPERPG